MEFDRNKIFRLGTRIKTRYEPHELYLTFDPEKKGFRVREDPDMEKIRQIRGLMLEHGATLNQKQIREIVKEKLDIPDKETRQLLMKGLGEFWDVEKGNKNACIYRPIKTSSQFTQKEEKENPKNMEELL